MTQIVSALPLPTTNAAVVQRAHDDAVQTLVDYARSFRQQVAYCKGIAGAAAVDAVAEYLRMLRSWTETRYAVAGNGAGVVAVSNRHSYIHARLGSARGE